MEAFYLMILLSGAFIIALGLFCIDKDEDTTFSDSKDSDDSDDSEK